MKRKKIVDTILPLLLFLVISMILKNYVSSIFGGPVAQISLMVFSFLLVAALEHVKFGYKLYTILMAALGPILGGIWMITDTMANSNIFFALNYSVLSCGLALIFNPIANRKMYAKGFEKIRNMELEDLKKLLPDKSERFDNEFLQNLTSIEQLNQTHFSSFNETFEIVEIRNLAEQNWTIIFVESKNRKSLVVVSRHEQIMKFYSLPVEEDYNADMFLYKSLCKLNG